MSAGVEIFLPNISAGKRDKENLNGRVMPKLVYDTLTLPLLNLAVKTTATNISLVQAQLHDVECESPGREDNAKVDKLEVPLIRKPQETVQTHHFSSPGWARMSATNAETLDGRPSDTPRGSGITSGISSNE